MTTVPRDAQLASSRPLRKKRVRPLDALFHAGVLGAVLIAMGALAWLLISILIDGLPAIDWGFLTDPTSTNADRAGFNSALRGSVVLMLITVLVALPLGYAAAIYLEKFAVVDRSELQARSAARRRRVEAARVAGSLSGVGLAWARLGAGWSALWARVGPQTNRIVEINLSNLAAVPSIVYGLLGLAVFVSFAGLQKSLLAGGLTLGLLVLPIIVIAAREAVRAVPVSIEQGAMALGATRWQAVSRQVVPAAIPGMLTGSILAMSRAIGEAAPLIVVGGIVFGTAVPSLNPFSAGETPLFAMPLQIFFWAGDARAEFRELAAGGIVVLLGVLILMNSVAIILRNRYSKRW